MGLFFFVFLIINKINNLVELVTLLLQRLPELSGTYHTQSEVLNSIIKESYQGKGNLKKEFQIHFHASQSEGN